jgi:gliding motility-associated-like protein
VRSTFKYLLILFLVSGTLAAQSIIADLSVINSTCNGFNDGRIGVHVTETNPPYTFLWNTGSEQNSVSNLAPGNYSVLITDASGNDTTITAEIVENPCLIAPEAIFTPNGDLYNDTWYISNIQYYPDNLILVFNRWGQKVFESKGVYEQWDGKDLLNIPVPDNSYYYLIYADKKDKEPAVKGTVSILR